VHLSSRGPLLFSVLILCLIIITLAVDHLRLLEEAIIKGAISAILCLFAVIIGLTSLFMRASEQCYKNTLIKIARDCGMVNGLKSAPYLNLQSSIC
jgi:hypothetical protein